MRTKASSIRSFTDSCDYDIYVIVETWLNVDFYDSEFFDLNFFQVFRKDRDPKKTGKEKGGGVLVAVKRHLKASIHKLNNGDSLIDQLCVSILGPSGNLYICASYVPPRSPYNLYCNHADNIVNLYDSITDNSELFVIGDFNLTDLLWLCPPGIGNILLPGNVNRLEEIYFIDNLFSLNLHQINNFENGLNRILDLIFISNDINFIVEKCLSPMCKPDIHHIPLVIHLEFYVYENIRQSNNSLYNFKLGNYDVINNVVNSVNWMDVFCNKNFIDCYNLFLFHLSDICAQHIPKFHAKIYKLPWYTAGLKKLKNLRNKFGKKYKAKKDDENLRLYNHYSREFNFLNKFLYKQYILGLETSMSENPKSFWSYIRSRKGKSSIPSSVFYDDKHSSNAVESANLFAEYFGSNYVPSSSVFDNYLLENIQSVGNFSALILSESDVLQGIECLKNTSGCDEDGLSSFFIKKCALSLNVPLRLIFNMSLECGIFLKSWKYTSITPVYKSGNKANVRNYRPISKISTISKLFEHIVCSKIKFFINPLIINQQHGFVHGRSTITNLTEFTRYCVSGFESGCQIDVVYLDYSKAFEKISHAILIAKLGKLGFHSKMLKWISSYLRGRICFIDIDGVKSNRFEATSGVPQGSVLGPLLFVLYINDIQFCFENCKFLLYADDLKVFTRVRSLTDALALQTSLNALCSWSIRNQLSFNFDKCYYVCFHRIHNIILYDYSICSETLRKVDEILDLGVIFDSKLSFDSHLNYIIPKSYSLLAFVKRNSMDFKDPCTRSILYCSFVRSTLEYASIVWCPNGKVNIDRLERIQKKFIKFALFSFPLHSINPIPSYENKCTLLGLKTLEQRRSIQSVMFLFDIVNSNFNCPQLLSEVKFNVPSRFLRYHNYFATSFHRTNYALNETLIRSQLIFNKLPKNDLLDFSYSKKKFKMFLYCNF